MLDLITPIVIKNLIIAFALIVSDNKSQGLFQPVPCVKVDGIHTGTSYEGIGFCSGIVKSGFI